MDSVRERFEKWAQKDGFDMERSPKGRVHEYEDSSTQIAWEAWQARGDSERSAGQADERERSALTFAEFSAINKHRCETKFHQCGDWLPMGWPLAIAGEAGELCNLIKKIVRGDFTFEEKRVDVLKELADVIIYCDLMITAMNADTGTVVADKFNEVSKRVGYEAAIRSGKTGEGAAREMDSCLDGLDVAAVVRAAEEGKRGR